MRIRGDTLAVRLNRIARNLRNIGPGEDAHEAAERIARDVEDLLYEASQDPHAGSMSMSDVMRELCNPRSWRACLEQELRTNPDALLDWWRYGLPEEAAIG